MEIAYSKYFKSYIKLIEYKTDDEWTFMLCNKNGKTPFWKRKVIKARTKYSDPDFIWITLNSN
jgi:hypothetical protein